MLIQRLPSNASAMRFEHGQAVQRCMHDSLKLAIAEQSIKLAFHDEGLTSLMIRAR